MFLPSEGVSGSQARRAEFTIEALKLNRDVLLEARANAYGSYRARLREYRELRDGVTSEGELAALVEGIRSMPHPTVWAEMRRQRDLIPELRPLFEAVPEALGW